MPLQATAGAATYDAFGGGVTAANYIEDVFQTWLYTGNDSTQTITNGVDLAGKGGLTWIKVRDYADSHRFFDTNRGVGNYIASNSTSAQLNNASSVTAFNSNGFSLGNFSGTNGTAFGSQYASWTFRKQPKFFDVVTYTGDGTSSKAISHSLTSTPGCIIVKRTDSASDWYVYHRGVAASSPWVWYMQLNTTSARGGAPAVWDVAPTTTNFTVQPTINASGGTYVAYLFAHNAGGFGASGTDNVISCGSFVCAGTPQIETLGYEPQWIMYKRVDNDPDSTGWFMFDNMRGLKGGISSDNDPNLRANSSAAETNNGSLTVTATGFRVQAGGVGSPYIYIAIRRGPMRTPTTGTSVFYSQAVAQAVTPDSTGVPFPPDLVNTFSRNGTDRTSIYDQFQFVDRLRGIGVPNNTYNTGGTSLVSSSTAAESPGSSSFVQLKADSQNITRGGGWNSTLYGNWIYYFSRRAPGFFDVVCYTGTGSATTFSHNLGAVPELMIVKKRDATTANGDWAVWHTIFTTTNQLLILNLSDAVTGSNAFNSTQPTASVFTVGNNLLTNLSSSTYVAYLFATVAGVSKVGSYTGTGTTLQVNCGFTGGARFVLIKRTDSTGDWYVWDSARGIVAGNDPYLLLNSTAAEVTSTDYVDTFSSGFEISSTAPAAINANGGTFIFLAIA